MLLYNPRVSVIILNWNGWQDTVECLESLYQINYPNYQVILVDNHSQDQSIQKIREYCQGKLQTNSSKKQNKPIKITEITETETHKKNPQKNQTTSKQLTLIKNNQNHGFAQGNNIAIKYTLKKHNPQYILLLNNDTTVETNFLNNLVEVAEDDDEIGLLGPLIYYYDLEGPSDVVANLGGKVDLTHYPGYYDLKDVSALEDYYDPIVECDWISGAALLMKIKEIPIKKLNPKLFFGCEDIDLAINLGKKGYKSVVVLKSHIWHKEGISRRKRSPDSVKRACMEIRSNLTFLKTHNKYYYWYLPIYILQISKIYLIVLLKSQKNRHYG